MSLFVICLLLVLAVQFARGMRAGMRWPTGLSQDLSCPPIPPIPQSHSAILCERYAFVLPPQKKSILGFFA